MSEMNQGLRDGAGLYLDDLQIGQRFTSGNYLIEAARIKEFAVEFDPHRLAEGATRQDAEAL